MPTQDENKKLEEMEKRNRELLNEKLDALVWEVHDVVQHKENPESQKLNMELDEMWVQG